MINNLLEALPLSKILGLFMLNGTLPESTELRNSYSDYRNTSTNHCSYQLGTHF